MAWMDKIRELQDLENSKNSITNLKIVSSEKLNELENNIVVGANTKQILENNMISDLLFDYQKGSLTLLVGQTEMGQLNLVISQLKKVLDNISTKVFFTSASCSNKEFSARYMKAISGASLNTIQYNCIRDFEFQKIESSLNISTRNLYLTNNKVTSLDELGESIRYVATEMKVEIFYIDDYLVYLPFIPKHVKKGKGTYFQLFLGALAKELNIAIILTATLNINTNRELVLDDLERGLINVNLVDDIITLHRPLFLGQEYWLNGKRTFSDFQLISLKHTYLFKYPVALRFMEHSGLLFPGESILRKIKNIC